MIKSVHAFNCGSMPFDKGYITHQVDMGKIVEMPFTTFLIRADEGNFLFDAGMSLEIVEHHRRTSTRVFNMTEEDCIPLRLAQIGVGAEDINGIIVSHLHSDHCGFLKAFPRAEIIVQRAEYRFAMNPPPYERSYVRSNFDLPGRKWRLIEGDEVIMPGMAVISTPGHTPGHQSLVLDLAGGSCLIITGDAVNTQESIDKEIIPGIYHNAHEAFYSLKRIKTLARLKNARLLFSHDIEWHKEKKKTEDFC